MSKSQARAEDRLSALPDEVICHILSFLRPTRIAVRTTILSKRWRNKWTLVPNLHFDDEEVHRHIDFTRYVNWLLDFRGPSNIRKFQLECSRDFKFWCSTYKDEVNAERKRRKYVSLIRRWIKTVIGRNLIELDLSIDLFTGKNDFELPKNLFLSKTLEYLKIGPNFIIKNLPSSGDIFSSLKFLDVVINWPDSNTLKNLFPHFPVLEVMDLIGFLYQNEDLNIISAPKLKTLKIWLDADEGENQEHQFYIKAPNLEYIDLIQAKTRFTVETTKFLVKAEVYIRARYSADRSECTITLPEGISNVKYLCLRGDCFEGCFLLTFSNLNQLNLRFRAFHYGLLLTDWLKRFPSLEYIDIQYNYLCHEDLHLPELVPSCVLSHLKTVSIRGFRGHHCEMEATKYLLRNSGVLSKMTIDTYHLNHEEDKVLLCKELLMCQRGSVNCQLEFIEEIGLFLGGMF